MLPRGHLGPDVTLLAGRMERGLLAPSTWRSALPFRPHVCFERAAPFPVPTPPLRAGHARGKQAGLPAQHHAHHLHAAQGGRAGQWARQRLRRDSGRIQGRAVGTADWGSRPFQMASQFTGPSTGPWGRCNAASNTRQFLPEVVQLHFPSRVAPQFTEAFHWASHGVEPSITQPKGLNLW